MRRVLTKRWASECEEDAQGQWRGFEAGDGGGNRWREGPRAAGPAAQRQMRHPGGAVTKAGQIRPSEDQAKRDAVSRGPEGRLGCREEVLRVFVTLACKAQGD
jgi:hypothetical protein